MYHTHNVHVIWNYQQFRIYCTDQTSSYLTKNHLSKLYQDAIANTPKDDREDIYDNGRTAFLSYVRTKKNLHWKCTEFINNQKIKFVDITTRETIQHPTRVVSHKQKISI